MHCYIKIVYWQDYCIIYFEQFSTDLSFKTVENMTKRFLNQNQMDKFKLKK